MDYYWTCQGCGYVFPSESMNLLDGEDMYCNSCMDDIMNEELFDDEEEEELE